MFNVLAINRHRIEIDGNGITTLIALSKCPLKCKYCLNKEIIKRNKIKEYTPEELVSEILIDYCYYVATNGGVTFGGGEPLLHANEIQEFAQLLPPNIQINIETSLNVPLEELKKVLPYITMFIIDIKTMNETIYQEYTKKNNQNVLLNLKYLIDNNYQNKCKIRIPLIPNHNTTEDRKKTIDIIKEMGFTNLDVFDYIIKKERTENERLQ